MRRCFLYLIIIGTCLFLSCNWQKKGSGALPIELVQAENIMYENPDSALQILQGMVIPMKEEAHATWALLLTQAKYKCNVKQSDSLVNIAYNYFKINGSAKRKVLALYIKGGIENDNNQNEKALELFLNAEKELDYINEDTLGFLITSHIGLIYAYQKIDEYAVEYSLKAYDYALRSQYNKYLIAACIQLARTYSNINIDESISYYEKAIGIARKHGDIKQMVRALIEVSGRYKEHPQKQYSKAMMTIKEAIKIRRSAQAYIVLGDIYRKIGLNDSACFYLNKASESENIYTARNAYQTLYNINKELGNYKKAVEYSEKLWNKQDSINKVARNRAIVEMQAKYDQQKVINEKNKAERTVLIILCISIGTIGVIVLCYQWKVLRQNKELEDKRKELNDLNNQLTENKNKIALNEERMAMAAQVETMDTTEELKEKEAAINNMRSQNEALKKDNQELLVKIEQREAVLQEKSKDSERLNVLTEKNAYLRKREVFLSNQLLKMDAMVTNLKKEPDSFKEYQWEELKEKTDALFDGYTERLLKKIPTLTTHDIHICCLIKLSFSNTAMADILGISPTSVSRQKQRLKERIVNQIGSLGENVLLDVWLREF